MSEIDFTALPYPNIAKACFTVTQDSGGINRERSVDDWAREYRAFIAGIDASQYDCAAIDAWLGTLSPDDLDTVSAGESDEMFAVMSSAPAGVNELLDEYFMVDYFEEDDDQDGDA